ncbi:hypothetical protein C0J52_22224 [Blattella germanica]|nr:hypothetical protein C0J52_22224 [Blattella germanica]
MTTRQLQQEILCGTKNRIALHSGGSVHVVVCPQPPSSQRHHIVEVFSEGWVISSTKLVHQPVLSTLPTSEQQAAEQSRSVIVEIQCFFYHFIIVCFHNKIQTLTGTRNHRIFTGGTDIQTSSKYSKIKSYSQNYS